MPSDRQIKAARLKIANLRNPTLTDKEILRQAGYSESVAKHPDNVTKSQGYLEVLEQYLPDDILARKHKQLLNHQVIDHMVFPLNITDDPNSTQEDNDKAITEIVEGVGCRVKKFMHSETATHVWYFVMNHKATQSALDMAYKLKGAYVKENKPMVNINFGVIVLPELND